MKLQSKNKLFYLFLFLIGFCFLGCEDPTEPVPEYVEPAFMIRTTNSGDSWKVLTEGEPYYDMVGLHFANDSTGVGVGLDGRIIRTTDKGKTWNKINSPVSSDLFSVLFINESRGVIVGDKGWILTTSDTGQSWNESMRVVEDDLRDVSFFNNDIGIAVGDKGNILRTTDGGNVWYEVTPITDKYIDGVDCFNDSMAVIAGSFKNIFLSKDYGKTWKRDSIQAGKSFYSVTFPTDSIGFLGGSEFIYKTTDCCGTWQKYNVDEKYFLAIHFIDENTGYACDWDRIIKTIDGGETWSTVWSPPDYDSFYELSDIYFINNNIGMVSCTQWF